MSSPPNFLNTPREIRQRILRYTRPDYDLRVDCKPAFIGWKFVPHYTHVQTQKWVRKLCLVNSEVKEDMEWVQNQWIRRGEQLAREQKTKRHTRVGITWSKASSKTEKARTLERWEKPLRKRYPKLVRITGYRAQLGFQGAMV